MRLLERQDGDFHLTEDLPEHEIPPYAVLSHTWGHRSDEVNFKDMVEGTGRHKAGYEKIKFCGEQAARDGLQFFWVDSCCIDKSSSAELQEAITSMYRWYQHAVKCYVHLADVSITDQCSQWNWEQAFRGSRWFTRGWTLQELLAPRTVEFFSREGRLLGDKKSLEDLVHEITGIAAGALSGIPMSQFEINERLSWAKLRHTTRGEDEAYSLIGILGISMPVLYGEGRVNAIKRLRKEINEAPERTLEDDSNTVWDMAFSPDGTTLASGSSDHTVRLWDLRSAAGAVWRLLEGHKNSVYAVAFSPDGTKLASGSADHTVRLWDLRSRSVEWRLEGHKDTVNAVAFPPNGTMLASGGWDHTVKLWDLQSGSAERTLEGHKEAIHDVAFSPDGTTLASGSGDYTVRLWDLRSRSVERTLEGHKNTVWGVAFSPDGTTLASGSSDHTVRLWDLRSRSVERTLEGHKNTVWGVAFSPDSTTLASGSWDHTVRLWDLQSESTKRTLEGHKRAVYDVAFSPDGAMLASGAGITPSGFGIPSRGRRSERLTSMIAPLGSRNRLLELTLVTSLHAVEDTLKENGTTTFIRVRPNDIETLYKRIGTKAVSQSSIELKTSPVVGSFKVLNRYLFTAISRINHMASRHCGGAC